MNRLPTGVLARQVRGVASLLAAGLARILVSLASFALFGSSPGAENSSASQAKPPPRSPRGIHWESYTVKASDAADSPASELTSGVHLEEISEPPQDYTYAAFGKPNPFIPPLVSSHFAKLEIPIVSLLQKYALERLAVVGIWMLDNGERKALVMTPKSEGVTVSVGDHAGDRGGRVIGITRNSVKIREFTLAPDGTRLFEDLELWLGSERPETKQTIVITSRNARNSSGEARDYLESAPTQETRTREVLQNAPLSGPSQPRLPSFPLPAASLPLTPEAINEQVKNQTAAAIQQDPNLKGMLPTHGTNPAAANGQANNSGGAHVKAANPYSSN